MAKISVVIPSRNERFLSKTIQDILQKAKGEVEVIAVLDGAWPKDHKTDYWETPAIIDDERVNYVHYSVSRGMRSAINAGVAVSSGEYILKTDGHCMFAEGFDEVLKKEHKEDNWIQIPTRKRLEAESWTLRDVNKPDMNYMYLAYPTDPGVWGGESLQGREWTTKNKDPELAKILIDDAMSAQGSSWFMKKSYFEWLEIEDEETYGAFAKEMQEIGLKCWLSGGKMLRNKKTFYAHLHKGKTYGRGYSLDKNVWNKAARAVNRWMYEKEWHKQTLPFEWLIEKFWPIPTWPKDWRRDLQKIKTRLL